MKTSTNTLVSIRTFKVAPSLKNFVLYSLARAILERRGLARLIPRRWHLDLWNVVSSRVSFVILRHNLVYDGEEGVVRFCSDGQVAVPLALFAAPQQQGSKMPDPPHAVWVGIAPSSLAGQELEEFFAAQQCNKTTNK